MNTGTIRDFFTTNYLTHRPIFYFKQITLITQIFLIKTKFNWIS
jgi:hypothetical protein